MPVILSAAKDLRRFHRPSSAMTDKTFHVYILASRTRVLYVGVTSDLLRRIAQHKAGAVPGFTARYHVNRLVHVEDTLDAIAAIAREKQIKRWTRAKKVALIESTNPEWRDLAEAEGGGA